LQYHYSCFFTSGQPLKPFFRKIRAYQQKLACFFAHFNCFSSAWQHGSAFQFVAYIFDGAIG